MCRRIPGPETPADDKYRELFEDNGSNWFV